MEGESRKPFPPPDPSKTLDAEILHQRHMSSPNSDYLSPWSNEASPELCDSALQLEDGTEAEGSETEGGDEVLNSSPRHAFSSDSKCAPVLGSPLESECPFPFTNNKPSNGTTVGVAADTLLSTGLMQNYKPVIAGAGLANLGNTCFLNSMLQCFIHTVPLLNGILSDTHSMHSNCDEGGFCVLCALRQLVELSLASTNGVVLPWNFVNSLSYFSSNFQRFQQEDAHEFLQCFLDRLESCCDYKQKEQVSSRSDNLVKQVFGGRLVSKLKCCSCGNCSDTYEPSIDLSLEIEDADNLLAALQSFTKVEKLEDPETKFTCENCKKQVSIEKQLSFDQAPSVASFHLKRFKNDGCLVQKIDKHVEFPLDLDLLPFTDGGKEKDKKLKYVLYAVVVHVGLAPTSGHYYCFIRLSPNIWCKFDDSRVVLVHEDFVLSQEAYILFYAEEGTPWFSSFVETEKLGFDSNMWNTSPKSVLDNAALVSPTLQGKFTHDSNGVSDDTASDNTGADKIEIKYSGPKRDKIESNERTDNLHGIPVSVAPFNCASSDVSLPETQREVSPRLLEKINLTKDATQIPTRSPSPEIYREDPPDAGFSIPHNLQKLPDRMSCKRRLEKDMDDLETRQACTLIKKTIPGSRGQQLLSALKGSKTEVSVNRKKGRRSEFPLSRDDRSAATQDSSSIRPAARSLVAGTYR